jgi:hypothetical protein
LKFCVCYWVSICLFDCDFVLIRVFLSHQFLCVSVCSWVYLCVCVSSIVFLFLLAVEYLCVCVSSFVFVCLCVLEFICVFVLPSVKFGCVWIRAWVGSRLHLLVCHRTNKNNKKKKVFFKNKIAWMSKSTVSTSK